MNVKIFLSCLLWFGSAQSVIFNGLVETGISKNNFLCPTNSSSSVVCSSSNNNAIGFNFSSQKILQIFNDQVFWLHEQAVQQKYVSQVLSYTGSQLEDKMNADGWGAMGSYCIIISTDPILTSQVMPKLIAKKNEQKVVVQLWYSGDNALQLWSQDAKILSEDAAFTVAVNNSVDTLPGVTQTAPKNSNSLRDNFLNDLHFQQNTRKESAYQIAAESPRSVKIQES
jgi:hypothetical protein